MAYRFDMDIAITIYWINGAATSTIPESLPRAFGEIKMVEIDSTPEMVARSLARTARTLLAGWRLLSHPPPLAAKLLLGQHAAPLHPDNDPGRTTPNATPHPS